MAEAIPFVMPLVGTVSAISNMSHQNKAAQQARQMQKQLQEQNKPIGWEEAWAQAQQSLNPIYDKQLEQVMRQSDKDLIARGFYGQLPGDALAQSRRWDVLNDKTAAIANLANQTKNQSQQNALNANQLAMQYALGQGNLRLQQWPQTWNTLTQLDTTWSNLLGYGKSPTEDDLTDGLQKLYDAASVGQLPPGLCTLPY